MVDARSVPRCAIRSTELLRPLRSFPTPRSVTRGSHCLAISALHPPRDGVRGRRRSVIPPIRQVMERHLRVLRTEISQTRSRAIAHDDEFAGGLRTHDNCRRHTIGMTQIAHRCLSVHSSVAMHRVRAGISHTDLLRCALLAFPLGRGPRVGSSGGGKQCPSQSSQNVSERKSQPWHTLTGAWKANG